MNNREGGFTYIEIMGALVVLVVGMLAFAGSFASSMKLTRTTKENELNNAAMRSVVDVLRNERLTDIPINFGGGTDFSRFVCSSDGTVNFYDSVPADLTITPTMTVGAVEFFTDESTVPSSFGPLSNGFDLNADGVIDTSPVADFIVLPTRVTVFGEDRNTVFDVVLASVGR